MCSASVPSAAPRNLTFDLSEQHLSLKWAELQVDELQGRLLAYKVQWTVGGEAQVRQSYLSLQCDWRKKVTVMMSLSLPAGAAPL